MLDAQANLQRKAALVHRFLRCRTLQPEKAKNVLLITADGVKCSGYRSWFA
jgi:hypothetical protein